jgi:putative ABC transport system permease protein
MVFVLGTKPKQPNFRGGFLKKRLTMIRNYFKVAFRSLLRNKLTSFINISGLALAMACSLLILLFIKDEMSFDRYHSKADRIYRVTRDFKSPDGSVNLHLGHVAPPFGPLLKNDFPDFDKVVRTLQFRILVALEESGEQKKAFNEANSFFSEPEIFDVFDIPVVQGNPARALGDPFHIMMSEKTAKRYFGDEQALGRSVKFGDRFEMVVSGVFKDFPSQSHWHPDILISFATLNDSTIYGRRNLETNWGNNSFSTYILVKEPFDAQKTQSEFPAFIDRHMGPLMGGPEAPDPSTWTALFLQKVTDIHLHSQLDSEIESNGNINNVYMMGVIGIFIVLIACFNFVNLSTARATKRSKEVGLRKVVGAFRTQLVAQFLSESILICFLALVLSIGVAAPAVNWLNAFTVKDLSLNLWRDGMLLYLALFALIIGIFAGIYPAFVISSFKPATILKGQQGAIKGKAGLRKVLVVLQFSISIVLIIATMITFSQLQYLNNRDLGYNKDQIITLQFFGELVQSYDAFYNELQNQAGIRNVARSSRTPTGRLLDSQGAARVQKGDSLANTDVTLKNISVDHEFFDTYGIKLMAGRNFSREIKSDDSLGFILNESAVTMMGLTPDQILTRDFQYGNVKGRVLGVVKDFHFESLHEPIVPMVFQSGRSFGNISVQVVGGKMQDALGHIEKVWKEFLPHRPFEYKFLSEQYEKLYISEKKQGQLFIAFAGLAIFIASLGLFGLTTFNTLQRIKEIGIRKVLGASVGNIVRLLSTEMVILILLANLIAWPVAWYFSNEWLSTFAYRIDNNFWLYVFAAIAALIIALITVGAQTVKAALSNPSETLRSE